MTNMSKAVLTLVFVCIFMPIGANAATVVVTRWATDSMGQISIVTKAGTVQKKAPFLPPQGLRATLLPNGYWEMKTGDGGSIQFQLTAVAETKADNDAICDIEQDHGEAVARTSGSSSQCVYGK